VAGIPPTVLTDADRRRLLRIARAAAARFLTLDEPPGGLEHVDVPARFGGCFVTLWGPAGLRGCRGLLREVDDIDTAVACAAGLAVSDPRFDHEPVTLSELPSLDVEVSVLSAPRPTDDPLSLIPGVHGLLIRHASRTGCFLPQVAREYGWNAEEMLSMCCRMKAGLPPDAWRSPKTEVLLFTADAFRESALPQPPPPHV
jgi:AmmeMemoRadiSam system protein A